MRVPLNDLMFALSKALDCVERELLGVTSNHGKRTALVSMRLCRALGLSEADVFDMATCAVLHDNALTAYMLEAGHGNIGRLEGFRVHCEKGEENAASFPFLGDASGIILQHHEHWDGTGFHKLAGKEIPLRAAVLRLADNLDLSLAMGDNRPELQTRMTEHARKYRGTLYAPDVVDVLLDLLNPDFVRDLSNERIDLALAVAVPSVRVEMSTAQMLRLCQIFALIIDAKSAFTRMHSSGLAQKIRQLAERYGFDDELCDKLSVAAYLHDVGKLATPGVILEKPGPLTHDEYEIMKDHVAITWKILDGVRGLEDITQWAGCHHERLDGSGYPRGYMANELSHECRLMASCDVYQALTEDRPYRVGMGHEQAMGIMRGMTKEGKLDADITASMDSALRETLGQADSGIDDNSAVK